LNKKLALQFPCDMIASNTSKDAFLKEIKREIAGQ